MIQIGTPQGNFSSHINKNKITIKLTTEATSAKTEAVMNESYS